MYLPVPVAGSTLVGGLGALPSVVKCQMVTAPRRRAPGPWYGAGKKRLADAFAMVRAWFPSPRPTRMDGWHRAFSRSSSTINQLQLQWPSSPKNKKALLCGNAAVSLCGATARFMHKYRVHTYVLVHIAYQPWASTAADQHPGCCWLRCYFELMYSYVHPSCYGYEYS